MKKMICLIFAVALVLSLAACSANVPEGFTRGEIDGATYTNTFTDVSFTLPDDTWVYSEDADIEFIMELSEGALSGTDEELAKLYARTPELIGFFAHNYNSGTTAMYVLDNLGISKYGNASTSAAEYLASIQKSRESDKEVTYEFGDIQDYSLMGFECSMLETYLPQYSGVQRYIAFKQGDVMNLIIMATGDTSYIKIAEAAFSKVSQ